MDIKADADVQKVKTEILKEARKKGVICNVKDEKECPVCKDTITLFEKALTRMKQLTLLGVKRQQKGSLPASDEATPSEFWDKELPKLRKAKGTYREIIKLIDDCKKQKYELASLRKENEILIKVKSGYLNDKTKLQERVEELEKERDELKTKLENAVTNPFQQEVSDANERLHNQNVELQKQLEHQAFLEKGSSEKPSLPASDELIDEITKRTYDLFLKKAKELLKVDFIKAPSNEDALLISCAIKTCFGYTEKAIASEREKIDAVERFIDNEMDKPTHCICGWKGKESDLDMDESYEFQCPKCGLEVIIKGVPADEAMGYVKVKTLINKLRSGETTTSLQTLPPVAKSCASAQEMQRTTRAGAARNRSAKKQEDGKEEA